LISRAPAPATGRGKIHRDCLPRRVIPVYARPESKGRHDWTMAAYYQHQATDHR